VEAETLAEEETPAGVSEWTSRRDPSLFTGVRGREILRGSPILHSENFACTGFQEVRQEFIENLPPYA
jgi:hypothetical protein